MARSIYSSTLRAKTSKFAGDLLVRGTIASFSMLMLAPTVYAAPTLKSVSAKVKTLESRVSTARKDIANIKAANTASAASLEASSVRLNANESKISTLANAQTTIGTQLVGIQKASDDAKSIATSAQQAVAGKANSSDVNSALGLKADKSQIGELPAGQTVVSQLNLKANSSVIGNIPAGQTVASQLDLKANASALSSYATTAALSQGLGGKADASLIGTLPAANVGASLALKANQSVIGTLPAATVGESLALKADKAFVGSIVLPTGQTSLAGYVAAIDLNRKQVEGQLRTDVDLKANSSDVTAGLNGKANQSYVGSITLPPNTTLSSHLTNEIAKKADKTAVDLKADKTAVDLKADKTTVDSIDTRLGFAAGTFNFPSLGQYAEAVDNARKDPNNVDNAMNKKALKFGNISLSELALNLNDSVNNSTTGLNVRAGAVETRVGNVESQVDDLESRNKELGENKMAQRFMFDAESSDEGMGGVTFRCTPKARFGVVEKPVEVLAAEGGYTATVSEPGMYMVIINGQNSLSDGDTVRFKVTGTSVFPEPLTTRAFNGSSFALSTIVAVSEEFGKKIFMIRDCDGASSQGRIGDQSEKIYNLTIHRIG